jgi:hypothetical protein
MPWLGGASGPVADQECGACLLGANHGVADLSRHVSQRPWRVRQQNRGAARVGTVNPELAVCGCQATASVAREFDALS